MHANLAAGIRVAPGTYHVNDNVPDQSHIYMRCGDDREDDFEVDFTGVFFYFTVRSPLSATLLHAPLLLLFSHIQALGIARRDLWRLKGNPNDLNDHGHTPHLALSSI